MALTPNRVAFFDVDNTLIRGSTLFFLGKGMYKRGYFTKTDLSRFAFANLRFRLTGKEKQDEIKRFQDAATEFIGGHDVLEIRSIAQQIYDEYVSPACWQGTINIAQKHLNAGEEVWLVTAAPEDMAILIAKNLGFTGALGSKAEVRDGKYTGSNARASYCTEKKRQWQYQLLQKKKGSISQIVMHTPIVIMIFHYLNQLVTHRQLILMQS